MHHMRGLQRQSRTTGHVENVHGSALQRWITRLNLKLAKPHQPTSTGRATVELFLSKGLTDGSCSTESGSWNTNHKLIKFRFSQSSPWKPPRILRHLYRDAGRNAEASNFYKSKLPELTNRLEACNSKESLESVSSQFCKSMLHLFSGSYSNKPQRFRKGWYKPLDQLADKRKKLLRRNARNANQEVSDQIKRIQKQIKRRRQANLRISMLRGASELEKLDHTEAAIRFARNRSISGSTEPAQLEGELMTAHLKSLHTHDAHIQPAKFNIQPSFAETVKTAIRKSPTNRAPEPDGIVVELLSLTVDESANFITDLRETVGRLGYIPTFPRTGIVTPIHKKGDKCQAANYRPTCLNLHIRKIISSSVNALLHTAHTFHSQQFGFTPGLGTEIASISAASIVRNGHKHIGILDLKEAYDRVRRDHLLQLCKNRLSTDLARMIENILVPIRIRSINQSSDMTADITLGVPQGDPISSSLYNIFFMDTCLE